MKTLINISFKNIFRHKSQSFIVGASIIISIAAMSFALCLSQGIKEQLVTNMVRIETGALTVHPNKDIVSGKNHTETKKIDDLLVKLKKIPDVTGIRERVQTNAHLYFDEQSQRISISGIDADEDSDLITNLKFSYLSKENFHDGKKIIISESIANKLNIKLDDLCMLVAQTVQGTINMEEYRVTGIYKSISEWSNKIVYMPLDEASELANAKYPTHLLFDIKRLEDVSHIKQKIQTEASQEGVVINIAAFNERTSKSSAIANANKYGFLFIVFFLQLISFFGISFSVMNALFEREREIGTMLGIGFSSFKIRIIFALETLFIALVSSLLGVLLVVIFIFSASSQGLYLGESAAIAFGSSIVKPILTLDTVIICFIAGISYPLVASLYSTRRLKKTTPIDLLTEKSLYLK